MCNFSRKKVRICLKIRKKMRKNAGKNERIRNFSPTVVLKAHATFCLLVLTRNEKFLILERFRCFFLHFPIEAMINSNFLINFIIF